MNAKDDKKKPTQSPEDPQAIAKRIVESSGVAFQCKVANYFRAKGWTVLISPYYVDSSTDKAREVDLIVEKSVLGRGNFNQPTPRIYTQLHIECKYIAQDVVFWFDHIDNTKARVSLGNHTPFSKKNTYSEKHRHAATKEVAKLFASDKGKGEDTDPFFRAINQALNGYIHNRGRSPLAPLVPGETGTILRYPVIVCSSFTNIHMTHVASNEAPKPISDNFLLEIDYAYVNKDKASFREYFLLDVVDFSTLDAFVKVLQQEADIAKLLV